MCTVCNLGVPACAMSGGCTPQLLDYVKILAMSGGAGLGMALTLIKTDIKKIIYAKSQ